MIEYNPVEIRGCIFFVTNIHFQKGKNATPKSNRTAAPRVYTCPHSDGHIPIDRTKKYGKNTKFNAFDADLKKCDKRKIRIELLVFITSMNVVQQFSLALLSPFACLILLKPG